MYTKLAVRKSSSMGPTKVIGKLRGAKRLSKMPDTLLMHLFSFLPSDKLSRNSLRSRRFCVVSWGSRLRYQTIRELSEALKEAVRKEDIDLVRNLISPEIGEETLRLVFNNDKFIERIEKGVRLPGDCLGQALVLALKLGHIEIARELLKRKDLDVNAKDENGSTALMVAAFKGYTEIVQALLAKETIIDVNAKDREGTSTLSWAVAGGHTEIVLALLAKKSKDGKRAVDVKAKSCDGNTVLMDAIDWGDTEIIHALLAEDDIDLNTQNLGGKTALDMARDKGYTEIVLALLAKKSKEGKRVIDINAKGYDGIYPLVWAAYRGHTEIVRMLLAEDDIDLNVKTEYETALSWAAAKGHTVIVRMLLAKKTKEGKRVIDVNDKGYGGSTALKRAAISGCTEIVSDLLAEDDIDLNAKDIDGKTALSWAASFGHTEIVRMLLAKKTEEGKRVIDVNVRNIYEKTALMRAAIGGHTEIVRILLTEDDIDLNAKDENGCTALMWAAFFGRTEIVRTLLAKKSKDGKRVVDVNARSCSEKTALDLARDKGYTEIVQAITDFMKTHPVQKK